MNEASHSVSGFMKRTVSTAIPAKKPQPKVIGVVSAFGNKETVSSLLFYDEGYLDEPGPMGGDSGF